MQCFLYLCDSSSVFIFVCNVTDPFFTDTTSDHCYKLQTLLADILLNNSIHTSRTNMGVDSGTWTSGETLFV